MNVNDEFAKTGILEEPTNGMDWCYNVPENQEIIRVYFNPDSNAGGQYVESHISYDLILEARENSHFSSDFFNIIDSGCTQYLFDINTPEFKTYVDHLKRDVPDFIGGVDEDTIKKFVEIANNGLSMNQSSESIKQRATIKLAERINNVLASRDPLERFSENHSIAVSEISNWLSKGDKNELADILDVLSELRFGDVLDTMSNQEKFANDLREVNDILYSIDHLDQYIEHLGEKTAHNSKYAIQEFRNSTLKILEGSQIPGKDILPDGRGIGFANRRSLYYAVKNFEEQNKIPENERIIHNDYYADKDFLYEAYDTYVGMSHQNDLSIRPYMKEISSIPNIFPLLMVAEVYYAQQNGLTPTQIEYALNCVKEEVSPAESFRNIRYGLEAGLSTEKLDIIKDESLMIRELLLDHMLSGGSIESAKALKGCDIAQYYLISRPLQNGEINCDMAQTLIKSINDIAEHAHLGILDKEFLTEYCVHEVLTDKAITYHNVETAALEFCQQANTKDFNEFMKIEGGFRAFDTKASSYDMDNWASNPWYRLQEESPMKEWDRSKKHKENIEDDLER